MTVEQLWGRYHASARTDIAARNALVERFGWLARRAALAFGKGARIRPDDREDLLAVARLALIQAIETYDPARYEWERYAGFRLRAGLVDYLREWGWAGKRIREQARRLEEAAEEVMAQIGGKPTDEQIAAYLEIEVDDLAELRSRTHLDQWDLDDLDRQVHHEEDGGALLRDLIAGDGATPEEEAACQAQREQLAEILRRLSPMHRDLLERRYLRGERQKSLAQYYGCHESRISQRIDQALDEARQLAFRRVLP